MFRLYLTGLWAIPLMSLFFMFVMKRVYPNRSKSNLVCIGTVLGVLGYSLGFTIGYVFL